MTKFWGFAGIILIVVLIGLVAADSSEINFSDLETECREDRSEDFQIRVEDNRLLFSGYFPVQSTDTDLDYDYDHSSDRITLNVKTINDIEPQEFERNCYATGVYEATSTEISGRYILAVKHNNEIVDKRMVNLN